MMLKRKMVDFAFTAETCNTRRRLLKFGTAASLLAAMPAWAKAAPKRSLAFEHLHTGEKLHTTYFSNGKYNPRALTAINQVLRDFRTGQVYPIHPELLDQLFRIHAAIGSDAPFRVICGYRSPATNEFLHRTTGGVAEHSLHMNGMAIDVRLADTRTSHLRDVAASLRAGGVGYYASSDFVHLDVGRPRQW